MVDISCDPDANPKLVSYTITCEDGKILESGSYSNAQFVVAAIGTMILADAAAKTFPIKI